MRLRAIPGVKSVGLVSQIPLGGGGSTEDVFTDQTTDLRTANAAANVARFEISPEYFHAAGTSLLAGRAFTWQDDKNAPRVAVVNAVVCAQSLRLGHQRHRQIFQDGGWNARTSGGHRRRRKILSTDRRSKAGDVSAIPAIVLQPDMPGGALGPRSASSWPAPSGARCETWMPACP